MKLRLAVRRKSAWTLTDVVVAMAVVALVLAIFLYQRPEARRAALRTYCQENLKVIVLSFKIWSGDCNDRFPTLTSVTNGGSMEPVQAGNVIQTFLVMTNELSTAKILTCPADIGRICVTNFAGLSNTNISYFLGIDATDADPGWILSGDSGFELGGIPVKPGLNLFWTNDPVTWSAVNSHLKSGNLAFTDGSVRSITSAELPTAFQLRQTGSATNRFAIP